VTGTFSDHACSGARFGVDWRVQLVLTGVVFGGLDCCGPAGNHKVVRAVAAVLLVPWFT